MRADELNPGLDCETGTSQRGRQPFSRSRARTPGQKRLARRAQQQRTSQVFKTPQRPKQLQIVLDRFSKTNTWVQYNSIPAYSAIGQSPEALYKKIAHLPHD